MSWVKLDTLTIGHPKVMQAGYRGWCMYVAGLCYSGTHLTDGFIPHQAVPTIALDLPHPKAVARLLVDVGLWEEAEGGYVIHDYLDYQRSREQVKRERSLNAGRVAKFRQGNSDMTPSVKPSYPENSNGDVTPLQTPDSNGDVTVVYGESNSDVTEPDTDRDRDRESEGEGEGEGEGASTRARGWHPPDWFEPLTRLDGYKPGNHDRTADAIRAACDEAEVGPAEVVRMFCSYYPRGRILHGWKDPVQAILKTLDVQVRKAQEQQPAHARPGRPADGWEEWAENTALLEALEASDDDAAAI